MKWSAAVMALTAGTVYAQVDWRATVLECEKLASDSAIASCVRQNVSKLRAEEDTAAAAASKKEQEDFGFKLFVRDKSSSVAEMSGLTLGDKGASISLQHKDGDDASQVQGALFARWGAYFGGRIQPFAGVSWLRDTTGTTKKDIRDVTVGTVGPLWESSGPTENLFSLLTTLQLTNREDVYDGPSEGVLARAHFDLAWLPLASGSLLGGVSVVPHVALLWSRRNGGGPEDGVWRSSYVGVAITKPFELGKQRFKASLLYRKLRDSDVPDGNVRRHDKYANVSLDYYFFNPEDEKAALQPSLFITREVGLDFLNMADRANKTTAGIRFKFN